MVLVTVMVIVHKPDKVCPRWQTEPATAVDAVCWRAASEGSRARARPRRASAGQGRARRAEARLAELREAEFSFSRGVLRSSLCWVEHRRHAGGAGCAVGRPRERRALGKDAVAEPSAPSPTRHSGPLAPAFQPRPALHLRHLHAAALCLCLLSAVGGQQSHGGGG